MKKTSSMVWRFFDRLQEDKRCVAVLCKLCDTQYKYFGNTTNLRTHLVNKHPIQWDLLHTGSLEETAFRSFDVGDANQSLSTKRKKYIKPYKDSNVDVLENSETDNEMHNDVITGDTEPISLVRQMHGNRGSDEEWLNDDLYEPVETYEPQRKRMKYRKIKQEVQSPSAKPKFVVRHNNTNYQKPERIIIDGNQRKDEYSVFGEYVGNKLRKMNNVLARGNVQQLITTILWQAEYGLYDNMETVKRVLLHSVQEMEVVHPTIETIIVQEPQEEIDTKEN